MAVRAGDISPELRVNGERIIPQAEGYKVTYKRGAKGSKTAGGMSDFVISTLAPNATVTAVYLVRKPHAAEAFRLIRSFVGKHFVAELDIVYGRKEPFKCCFASKPIIRQSHEDIMIAVTLSVELVFDVDLLTLYKSFAPLRPSIFTDIYEGLVSLPAP